MYQLTILEDGEVGAESICYMEKRMILISMASEDQERMFESYQI